MRRDVKLLYDVMADTIGYIQVKFAARMDPRAVHTLQALRARRDY